MSRRLIISPQAEADLEEIGDHIAQDSPRQAIRIVSALREKCALISAQPFLYPLSEETAAGFRRALVTPYGIWFQVLDNGDIRVERIVHGSRDLPSLFEAKG